MKNAVLCLGIAILFIRSAHAQHQDLGEKPSIWRGFFHAVDDSATLLTSFRQGQFNGHFRYFFMATDNAAGHRDYYANAAGGGIRYESGAWNGFQVGISGFFIFNVGSSDLGQRDSLTNAANRYETGLFDVEDPYNRTDIDRLEEFQVKYNFKKSHIQFGKMLINSPLINLQDGRMRPTGTEGVWIDFREINKLRIEGGFLYGFSPRGTTRWFRGARSIGVYPVGVNSDGTRSGYFNNLSSQGVGVIGMRYNPVPIIRIQVWDYYIDAIQNSLLIQIDFSPRQHTSVLGAHEQGSSREKTGIFGGVQFIRQDALANGGNADPSKTYTAKNARAMTIGAQAGWRADDWEYSLNYNRITAHGRYLFPREWGRDPFYTFMPRERNDGFADVHAVVGRVQWNKSRYGFTSGLSAGYFRMPDVRDFEKNKYGMPSYTQINADLRYASKGIFKGMETQLLIVGKLRNGEVYNDKRYVVNKVDMILYNLVVNYHF